MTTTYLLDINLLLALSDPQHVHHEAAHRWFAETGHASWATCPITENGFVRVASHPTYPNRPGNTAAIVGILQHLCKRDGHRFWTDDISLREIVGPQMILTHAQITDIYLLALAIQHGGKLATLDKHMPSHAILGGRDALELIMPRSPR